MTYSVIIPAYNAEKYIIESIASVRDQTERKNAEIIVVDDGSSDDTVKMAGSVADRVLKQDHRGAASARNTGIMASTGKFILLLDADDRFRKDAVCSLSAPVIKDVEVSVVFGKAFDFISHELSEEQKSALIPRNESYGGVLPGCTLIRREVFDQIGLFKENLNGGETIDWMLRLKDSGLKTVQIDYVTLDRRLHLTNTGRLEKEQELKNYAAILRARKRQE